MYEIFVPEIVPPELLEAFTEEMVYEVLENIANGARAEWVRLAKKELHTSQNDYVTSIQPVVHKKGIAILSLVGQPANLIENGMEEVDLRKWLLGDQVPVAKHGTKGKRQAEDGHFYRSIPFRHGTPGTLGGVGAAMGDPYQNVVENSKQLGRAVYNAAKKLESGERLPSHMRYGKGQTVPKLKAHHTADIYSGMQKFRAAYNVAIQSQYVTFRTISETGGDPQSWIRPTTEAKSFIPRVQQFVVRTAAASFQAYAEGLSSK